MCVLTMICLGPDVVVHDKTQNQMVFKLDFTKCTKFACNRASTPIMLLISILMDGLSSMSYFSTCILVCH